jgi:hypothetical protein
LPDCACPKKQQYTPVIVAFYNFENFYDTINNPNINDEDFLPNGTKNYNSEVLLHKVQHLATIISQIGINVNPDGIAIIVVAEIENDTVLNDLIHHSLLKDCSYGIVHYDSRDIRGVDLSLLYNPKYFTVLNSKSCSCVCPERRNKLFYKRCFMGERNFKRRYCSCVCKSLAKEGRR